MIVTRAVVAVVTIEAETQQAVDDAFDDLSTRVHFALPKLRFGDVRIKHKLVRTHSITSGGRVSYAGQIRAVPRA